MNCPLCDIQDASATEKHDPDWTFLHCAQCGDIIFTDIAYTELGQLGENERTRVAEYCRKRKSASEVITHVRLKEIKRVELSSSQNESTKKT